MLAATISRIGIEKKTQKTSSLFFYGNMAEPEKDKFNVAFITHHYFYKKKLYI
jgi:hypothetical protein